MSDRTRHEKRPYDVRDLVKKVVDAHGRQLARFETLGDAKRERRHRIRVLRAGGDPDQADLADILDGCRKGQRCGSLACPVCARLRRIRNAKMLLRFLNRYPIDELRFVTLINPADTVPAGSLGDFDARRMLIRRRRQLERTGLNKREAFFVGFLDGEWDDGWEVYQPHIHGISWNISAEEFEELTKKWPKSERVRVRKQVRPIDSLERTVLYLDKSFWPSVARGNNPNGLHPHGKRRPPKEIEQEILMFLQRNSFSELSLFYGLRKIGRRIVKIK